MNIIALMATIILIATLATLVFAFAAYFVTKAKRNRARKSPVYNENKGVTVRTYFERYMPMGKVSSVNKTILSDTKDSEQWT